ncbi:alcohol dehydrogenase catalytic domain-containing protein [Pseudolysinimonas sp.]|uniref:alcohol dehydrogenase catalytic domain-containing protein n=1 Tax=Pseudolysinimonas sp. TaxID=2680009 RepID=UPI003F7DA754
MRAVRVLAFGQEPELVDVPVPAPGPRDALVRVEATGLCRSDAHAWRGADETARAPYTPGHEFVGIVAAVGAEVTRVGIGQRVTTPFVCGCGACDDCRAGRAQVCRFQEQPGFTYDGSFAEYVLIRNADLNAVVVPDDVDPAGAALLGCRFATSYRGLVDRAALRAGETVAVLGCGGVGLSAVLIAVALEARVVAVDVAPAALERARAAGAHRTVGIEGLDDDAAVAAIRGATDGGPAVAVEALGRAATLAVGVRSLASEGRLVQIGLLGEDPVVPMGEVIARELAVLGSHGMAAADYPRLLDLVRSGGLDPASLVTRTIALDEAPAALSALGAGTAAPGVTMIRP